jgi:DNA-binding CsgD family transcriptional regulator
MRELALPGRLVWSLAGAVQATALAGDRARSNRLLAELDAVRTPERLLQGDVDRARAWNAVAQGAITRAQQIFAAAAATAGAAGMLGMELGLLHDLVRLGGAMDRDRVALLADRVEGALAMARHDHIAAVIDRDGTALDAVADRFEQLGAWLLAADASAHAAAAHERRGKDRKATASRRRALERSWRCQGARTPALDSLGVSAALSLREREFATLASGGLGNRTIAEQLFVSLRTVENHLAHVYTKLGVTRRDDLAAALGSPAAV